MQTGNIVPLFFAAPLLCCLILREARCRKRLQKWEHSQGKMLCMKPDGDGELPIISYEFEGEIRKQECEFNLTNPTIGDMVPILVNPETGEIFLNRKRDRWALSALILFSLLFLGILASLSS